MNLRKSNIKFLNPVYPSPEGIPTGEECAEVFVLFINPVDFECLSLT